jgi:arylsulfatase A-like enzyme
MRSPADRNRFGLALPAAGFAFGVVVGLADWSILTTDWGNSQSGMWYLPPFAWLAVIWTSITICTAAGILFSWPRLGRLRGVALAATGLALLLIRSARPLRESFGLSTTALLLVWLGILLLFAMPLALLPLRPVRHSRMWIAATAASALLLVLLAAGAGPVPSSAAPQTAGARNVVLIFLDTIRYDDVFGEGDSAMPNLAAFARRSTIYDSAWAAEPWTIPSHYSVLRGTDPWTVPYDAHGFQANVPALAERFASSSYDTVAILANPLLGNPDFSAGFRRFTYSRASGVCRSAAGELLNRLWVHGGPRSPLCGWLVAGEVTARALASVRSSSGPYFLVLNYMDGHYPYYVPPDCRGHTLRMMSRADRETFRHAEERPAGAALLEKARAQHRAAARCLDHSLAALLAQLQRNPRTIIAVVGDHGEQFGEHGLIEHGNSVYAQAVHVPLIVHADNGPGRVAEAVSITDLYRSLPVLAGSDRPGARVPLSDPALRRPAISGFGARSGTMAAGAFSAVLGHHHFILWRGGQEALFDIAADPAERSPIPTTTGPGAQIAAPLRALASQAMAAAGKSSVDFRALNYLQ